MKPLVLCAALLVATPALADDGASALVASFMQDWSKADAKALAALFAPDADLVTPDGIVVKGRDRIGAFYAYAFANGYAGSRGAAEIAQTRALAFAPGEDPNVRVIALREVPRIATRNAEPQLELVRRAVRREGQVDFERQGPTARRRYAESLRNATTPS